MHRLLYIGRCQGHMPLVGARMRIKTDELRRMFTPETGGELNKVYHWYAYSSMGERERVRQDMVDRDKWLRFLAKSRPHIAGPQARPTMHQLSTALNQSLTRLIKEA